MEFFGQLFDELIRPFQIIEHEDVTDIIFFIRVKRCNGQCSPNLIRDTGDLERIGFDIQQADCAAEYDLPL